MWYCGAWLRESHISGGNGRWARSVRACSLRLSQWQINYNYYSNVSLYPYIINSNFPRKYLHKILLCSLICRKNKFIPDIAGCGIARSVTGRFPTMPVQVRSYVRSPEIYGGRNRTGEDFIGVLRLPLPILIPPTVPYPSVILSSALHSLNTDSFVK